MPITKQDPVKNMDTGEEIKFPDPHDRITRGLVKRILTKYGIEHEPGITRDEGMHIMRMKNIPFDPPPPGPMEDTMFKKEPEQKMNGHHNESDDIDTQIEELKRKKAQMQKTEGHVAKDGYPAHIGKMKKFAKDRGVKVERTDKREDLIRKLEELSG